jgi:hypothetical protein
MQKLLNVATLILLVGLSACNKDEENPSGQLSKAEAQAKINAFSTTATDDLQDLASSEGLEAIVDLSNLVDSDDPFGGRLSADKKRLKTFFRAKGHLFRTILDKNYSAQGRTKGEEPFDFEAHTGVYEWNANIEQFEKTGSDDIIRILFPTEGSSTNNAEFQLLAYEEVEVYDAEWGETMYEPTVLQAALLVDDAEVASLDLNIEWDEEGFPITADLTAEVVPFKANVSFDVSASNKNTLSASLLRGQETLFSTSVEVLYSGTDKSEEDLKTISGHVQLIDLKLEGTIDVEGMDTVEEEPDLNDFIDLTLSADNKKIGDIIFETEIVDGYEESVAYIQYADGTKEKLEDVLQPVIDKLEEIEEDLNS